MIHLFKCLPPSNFTGISPIGVCFVGSPQVQWVNRCAMSAALRSRSRLSLALPGLPGGLNGTQDVSDHALLGEAWNWDVDSLNASKSKLWLGSLDCEVSNLLLALRTNQV